MRVFYAALIIDIKKYNSNSLIAPNLILPLSWDSLAFVDLYRSLSLMYFVCMCECEFILHCTKALVLMHLLPSPPRSA